jgi:hypothetical protein
MASAYNGEKEEQLPTYYKDKSESAVIFSSGKAPAKQCLATLSSGASPA